MHRSTPTLLLVARSGSYADARPPHTTCISFVLLAESLRERSRWKVESMILRYWRGWTTEENADLYDGIVREVLAGIAAREVAGYRGAYLARRELGDETEFATILLFDSTESVRAFAGDDYEIAYVPRQAREVLARYDERSLHFEILLTPEETQ
jgi:hypothetical protein